jgi:hypothetical protein
LQVFSELFLFIIVKNGFGGSLNFQLDLLVERVDALVHEFEEDLFGLLFDGGDHDDFFDD